MRLCAENRRWCEHRRPFAHRLPDAVASRSLPVSFRSAACPAPYLPLRVAGEKPRCTASTTRTEL